MRWLVTLCATACGPRFAAPVQYTVGNMAEHLTVGDFDGDGKLDIAVSTFPGTIDVLRGVGDGTFRAPLKTPSGTFPASIAAADFDGDGKLDVAVSAGQPLDGPCFLGNGDGTFRRAPQTDGRMSRDVLAVGDFDGDGRPDLVVDGVDEIHIYLNRAGRLTWHIDYPVAHTIVSLLTADFNGDGKLDIAVGMLNLAGGPPEVSVLLGKGDGSFGAPVTTVTAPGQEISGAAPVDESMAIAAADLDGDGRIDLAVAHNLFRENIGILLGLGDGHFAAPSQLSARCCPRAITVGDFDGDGRSDLAVAVYGFASDGIDLFRNKGGGTFDASPRRLAAGRGPRALVAADFNGDGKLDLAVGNKDSNDVSVLLHR
jgi:hypothetical protein